MNTSEDLHSRLIEANNNYTMNKPFTFSKSQDDNQPRRLPDDFLDEKESMPDHEIDETYLEVDDLVDRVFISNRDLGDEFHPSEEL